MPKFEPVALLVACPQCGNALTRKINRATEHPFVGCSGFPECKFTANIGELEAAILRYVIALEAQIADLKEKLKWR